MSTTHSSFDQYCISHKTISNSAAPGPEVHRESPWPNFQLCLSSQQILATPLILWDFKSGRKSLIVYIDKVHGYNEVRLRWLKKAEVLNIPKRKSNNVWLTTAWGMENDVESRLQTLLLLPPSTWCFIRRLFVCLSLKLATPRKKKNYLLDLHENFARMYLWARKNWLTFGSHPRLNSDLENLWKDSLTLQDGAFLQPGSYLWNRLTRSS